MVQMTNGCVTNKIFKNEKNTKNTKNTKITLCFIFDFLKILLVTHPFVIPYHPSLLSSCTSHSYQLFALGSPLRGNCVAG